MAITFYATNNFTGDGTTVNWNINFADGYIDIANVKARYLDSTGSYVDIAISSVAGNVVTITPAVASGQEFQIYRDTEKRFPLVDFSDGAILNEANLDTLATQAVMVSAEAFDQSNNGVRIAGDSLVVAQGIDAKAQEALDNSEAAVATADGIAATANLALTNANAAVVTANAANSTANGIASTANQALTNSNTAISTANGAVSTANSAEATANAIDGKATTAINTANSAVSTANTASSKADTAISTANSAVATANASDGKAQSALDNVAALDLVTLKKSANLSDLGDRAAAWLNVRPTGSTSLSANPVNPLDATTKQWVEGLRSVKDSWSAVTEAATRPVDGTMVSSGVVGTEYRIAGTVEAQSTLYTSATLGGTYSTQITVKNATSGKSKDISVTEDGDLWSDRFAARFGTLMTWSETGNKSGAYSLTRQQINQNYGFNSLLTGGQAVNTGYATALHHGLIHNDNGSFAQAVWLVAGDDNAGYITKMFIQPNSYDVSFFVSIPGSDSFYTLQKNAISDANLKHDIAAGSVDKAWSNLAALQYVTFVYNNDEQERIRRGIIAQQAETVDPLYVKTVTYHPDVGVTVQQKQLDTTPMLLDTMHVVQTLMAKVEALEARIAELTSQ